MPQGGAAIERQVILDTRGKIMLIPYLKAAAKAGLYVTNYDVKAQTALSSALASVMQGRRRFEFRVQHRLVMLWLTCFSSWLTG